MDSEQSRFGRKVMNSENKVFGSDNTLDPATFIDRRSPTNSRQNPGLERRQFTNSYQDLSPDAAELGQAIDQYKLINRRRYITYEEMLSVIKSLGYTK